MDKRLYPCVCGYCGKQYVSPIHPRFRQDGERPGRHQDGRLICPCAKCCISRYQKSG